MSPQEQSLVWDAFTQEPGIGVTIITLEGEVAYANEEAARMYLGKPADVTGRRLEEISPPEIAAQTLERGQRCVSEDRSFSSRIVWRGRQVFNSYHPLREDHDGEPDRFLIISRHAPGEEAEAEFTSEFVDLGELSVLTPRELEVLALIGQGLRIADIARILHRSERTIEKHRESIGRKLNRTDRVQLALIASRAGLRVEDAKLKRLSVDQQPGAS
jgi:DNA-binding NarL/FixJ family response regulator